MITGIFSTIEGAIWKRSLEHAPDRYHIPLHRPLRTAYTEDCVSIGITHKTYRLVDRCATLAVYEEE